MEEIVQKEDSPIAAFSTTKNKGVVNAPKNISEIVFQEGQRITTTDNELNRVLGGGIVPGSLILMAGEPGIGKSTLMLQTALGLQGLKILYVSGEESEQQVKMRADRLALTHPNQENCYVLAETSTHTIFKQIELLAPDLVMVDSVQTLTTPYLESSAGSVSQVRECTAEFLKFAKENHVPVFLIGHITKDGTIAGPKILEHMVDTVLQFEGDRHLTYRIVRTLKNRFGSASELGIYEMQSTGLRQVNNPSEILLSQKDTHLSGVAIAATLEGNRPLLIEIQSLVSPATYGTPQRSATGFDAKRLNMLLAVLEKRGGFRLGQQDVFLNIAGGIKVEDPAVDLAVCVSLISSYDDLAVPENYCFAAEVGLGGEVRAVNRMEQRITEAEKLGFTHIIVSKFALKGINHSTFKIKVIGVSKLDEVFSEVFG